VNAAWSPGSSKVRKSERGSRIDLAKLAKTASFTDNATSPPPKPGRVRIRVGRVRG